jgi:hypothetical protein
VFGMQQRTSSDEDGRNTEANVNRISSGTYGMS